MKVTFIKTGKRLKQKSTSDNTKKEKESSNKIIDSLKVIFRKNQLILLTLALMLITAGYMNYNYNENDEINIAVAEIGDAKLVSANVIENISITEELNEVIENIESNTNVISMEEESNIDNYFTQTRLERETMYSQMLETYEDILENENIPADQKSIASNEIKNINNRKNAISIVENLIKTKGFEDVVLLINDNNINIVVKYENNLTTEQVAQITNIVSRELNAEIENIHISIHN